MHFSAAAIIKMLGVLVLIALVSAQTNADTWKEIDNRPLPDWYDKAKFGIFMHWGVYSVPSFSSEWFWIDWKGNPSPNKIAQKQIIDFMAKNYKPGFSYEEFAPMLTAEFFNATQWAEMIKNSGAKYFVITSKHHDGFAMWPSKYSKNWNSQDIGPHRDVLGELKEAIYKTGGIHFGVYHSLYEWFHPLYLSDKANDFNSRDFVDQKIFPEMKELVNKYEPEIFWSDGDWEAPDSYWRSIEFIKWMYNKSSEIVTNDRWGKGTMCHHGGYLTCSDRFNPGKKMSRKWEDAMTVDRNSWGYVRTSNLEDYLSIEEIMKTFISTIAYGGNMLMNVGPTKEGTIMPLFQERLAAIGSWLKMHGKAIYGTKPWQKCTKDTYQDKVYNREVWYTSNEDKKIIYAIFLDYPKNGQELNLSCPELSSKSKVYLVGHFHSLKAITVKGLTMIKLPPQEETKSKYAWVLRMTDLEDE